MYSIKTIYQNPVDAQKAFAVNILRLFCLKNNVFIYFKCNFNVIDFSQIVQDSKYEIY
jgi:hypothetical protein